jgi:hypothetical protein
MKYFDLLGNLLVAGSLLYGVYLTIKLNILLYTLYGVLP